MCGNKKALGSFLPPQPLIFSLLGYKFSPLLLSPSCSSALAAPQVLLLVHGPIRQLPQVLRDP